MAISQANIVVKILKFRCVLMELHALKVSFSTNIYMAFGATTINFVTMACSFHKYKFSMLVRTISVTALVFQSEIQRMEPAQRIKSLCII